jgi:general secretion pathway protein A
VARFEPEGLDLVHEYTKGIPRLVNMVCSRALAGGASAGTNRVTAGMVTTAATSLDLSVAQTSTPGHLRGRAAAFAAGAAAAALLAAVAAAIWYGAVTLPDRSADRSPSPPAEAQAGQISPKPEPSRSAESSGLPALAAEEPIATSGNTPAARPAHGAPDPSTATPSTTSAALEGGNYSVLVASFRQGAEAAALCDQLRDLGYRARTVQVETAMRGTWHLVFAGPYTDIDPARLDEARLRQLPGYRDARLVVR